MPVGAPRVEPSGVRIVVLNWNRCDETLACLESLGRANLRGAKVLVVDNGSTDASAETIRARHPDVRVIALPRNEGYAGGNNAGIRAALADGATAVMLLNNDTEVTSEFLEPLLDVLNGQPTAAAVSAAIHRADSPEVMDVAYLDVYFGHGLVHRRGVNAMPGEGFDRVKPVQVGVGCCLLMAADALRTVGLLDEAYFAYHEEVDWCWRARKRGYRVFFQPYSRVYHHGSVSTGARAKARRRQRDRAELPNAVPLSWSPIRTYLGARNAVRFVRKHGGPVRRVYFALSSLYAVPLALLAVLMDREEELMLGLWTYRRALALYCRDGDGSTAPRSAVRAVLHAPVALACELPRDVARAHREGVTVEIEEHLRGLWDGIRDRPLPLERLGLR